jgi:hypothetical protein
MAANVSTEEQDAWAYVATGSESYGPWVRQRTRMRTLIRETERWNATQRAITEQFRAGA